MNRIKKLVFLISIFLITPIIAQPAKEIPTPEQTPSFSMQELLERVKQGRVNDASESQARLKEFLEEKSKRKVRLDELLKEKADAEALSEQLEEQYQRNDEDIAGLESTLEDRLGSVKELFGVLQLVASDTHAQFSNSITQIQFADRTPEILEFANKMGQTKSLPEIQEIEALWYELQREMVASSLIETVSHNVVNSKGIEQNRKITRVGLFNLVSEGNYLQFVAETGRVIEYAKQPDGRYMGGAASLKNASIGERVMFSVDPTRGQLLSLLVKSPTLTDRVNQGGVIGYIIISLGVFAIAIAVMRFVSLSVVGGKINHQKQHPDKPGDNPLGRILKTYQNNKQADHESLELKLGETILKEVPAINKNLSLLKIIAAIAPLMGLLGTVTGMIITFQAITLFGAGDPKLMANGISQALVTTVLGLVVAIPTLLLHNLIQTKAKTVTEILEQESIAIVAASSEVQIKDRD